MDIDATFKPVSDELINNVFPTPIVYLRSKGMVYDPATGEVTEDVEQFNIKAGIEQISIQEEGGVAEEREIKLWIDHGSRGMPHEPTTGDRIEYKGRTWKVTGIDPEFVSISSIASCVFAKADA